MENRIKILIISLLVILFSIFVYFVSQIPDDSEKSILKSRITNDATQSNLILLGSYRISSGYLYKYKLDTDTIYVVEGTSSSYPISISTK